MLREFIHLFAPLTVNCKDFTRRWNEAATFEADTVAGRWEGQWISAATGHHGPLSAVLIVTSASRWRVSFRAGYAGVFRACYATDFTVTREEDRWIFTGGSDLGAIAGGRYDYAGSATVTEMSCTYKSSSDHGEFRLSRKGV